MANSRSNIYPVQLQGAELNLNKLDAEIKQYSGFNKNNSPFVGGCLSNIFTKDETIEGATSQNTYIAPNGDVYRVNTEGLWKNEEKLVDYTGKKFYTVEECEIQFPNNTVFVDSEYVYVTSEYSPTKYMVKYDFFLNVYNFFTNSWDKIIIPYNQPESVLGASPQYSIDAKVFKNDNEMLIFVVVKTFKRVSLRVFKTDINGTSNVLSGNQNITTHAWQSVAIPLYPAIVQLEVTSTDGGIVTVIENADSIYNEPANGHNYSFNLEGQTTFIGTITSSFRASVSKLYKCALDANTTTEDLVYDYVIHNGEYVTSNPKSVTWDSNFKLSEIYFSERGKNVVKNFGFIKIDYKPHKSNNDIIQAFACCDFITQAIEVKANDNNYKLNTGALVGDYVLYNNCTVSGICLPGGIVLVSEWNTVDADNIFVQKYKQNYSGVFLGDPCEVIYKSKDKWVKLKEGSPILKKINNQIIINVNDVFNSYNLTSQKKLLFAPAWNNRFPINTSIWFNKQSPEQYYIASAINEYSLEDNASIILNPLPSVLNIGDNDRIQFDNKTGNVFVDFYSGLNEVIYKGSSFLRNEIQNPNELIFEELYKLPFPTNTDGNVQYSPSLFATEKGKYGNLLFISEGGTAYKLMTYDNKEVMSYFLSTAIEGLQDFFTIQGQLYGILNNGIYGFSIINEVANRGDFIVSVEGLQFVGNTPYEALFFSKTNRCLYSFTGANVLNSKQFVDKISEVRNYKYNPATQSIFLITDIGVIVYSLFGIYQIEFANCQDMYLLNNGVILTDNEGTFKYVKYYKEETTDDYTKENIQLETMFYGMNNQTVTINDCLYMRIFSEEHEEGDLEVSATTLSLEGRMTEKTTFKIKASDWDKLTHTIYLRYQPKEQRGLGISFSINSPFKIASLSIGSQADAILIDKVSKGAINAPQRTSNNVEW